MVSVQWGKSAQIIRDFSNTIFEQKRWQNKGKLEKLIFFFDDDVDSLSYKIYI